jgi:hypothetical protein
MELISYFRSLLAKNNNLLILDELLRPIIIKNRHCINDAQFQYLFKRLILILEYSSKAEILINYMIDNGYNINGKYINDLNTSLEEYSPITQACILECKKFFKIFLARGGNLNAREINFLLMREQTADVKKLINVHNFKLYQYYFIKNKKIIPKYILGFLGFSKSI